MSQSSQYWQVLSQVATVVEDKNIPVGTKQVFLINLAEKYEQSIRVKQPSQIRPEGLKQVERCTRLCKFALQASEQRK